MQNFMSHPSPFVTLASPQLRITFGSGAEITAGQVERAKPKFAAKAMRLLQIPDRQPNARINMLTIPRLSQSPPAAPIVMRSQLHQAVTLARTAMAEIQTCCQDSAPLASMLNPRDLHWMHQPLRPGQAQPCPKKVKFVSNLDTTLTDQWTSLCQQQQIHRLHQSFQLATVTLAPDQSEVPKFT